MWCHAYTETHGDTTFVRVPLTRLLFLHLFSLLGLIYCYSPPVTSFFIHCNSVWFISQDTVQLIIYHLILHCLHISLHYLFSYILNNWFHKIWELFSFPSQSAVLWNHVFQLVTSGKTSYIWLILLHINYLYPETASVIRPHSDSIFRKSSHFVDFPESWKMRTCKLYRFEFLPYF